MKKTKIKNKVIKTENCKEEIQERVVSPAEDEDAKKPVMEEPVQKDEFTVWCDDSPSLVLSNEYMDRVQESGISRLSFMINKANVRVGLPEWQVNWSTKQLERAAKTLKDRGVKVGITKWCQPNSSQLKKAYEGMIEIIEIMDPDEIEDDSESNWTSKFLEYGTTMEYQANKLFEGNLKLAELNRSGERRTIVVTSFPGHKEMNKSTATYSIKCDKTRNQLYGVRKRRQNGKEVLIGWDHPTLGPGHMQDHYLPKMKELGPEVGCGLPGYDLSWPGHTKREAFMKQYKAAKGFGVTDFGVWSSKWLIGKLKQKEVIDAIKEIVKG